MIYIGIDPGAKGGIASIDCQGFVVACEKFEGRTHSEIFDAFETIAGYGDEPRRAILEKVGPGPKQSAHSSFTFGRNYGFLEGVLSGLSISFDYATPVVWQRPLGLIIKGRKGLNESNTAKKNRNKQKAQQLFPDVKITHAIADALLIAEYLRRLETRGE